MNFKQAVKKMAESGRVDQKALTVIVAEVEAKCKTSTNDIDDWLAGLGGYTGKETPSSIAREWDALQE